MRKKLSLFVICALLLTAGAPALAMSRAELRAHWQQICEVRSDDSPYLEVPDPVAYAPGALTDAAQADALNCLNFLRRVAGLGEVKLNSLYTFRAQNGALLLAANDALDHNAPQPEGMDDAQYETAHMGTSLGNIARFNWMKSDILIDGVSYFARDDGDANLSVLGHRRWLLNPQMAETGFGLANSESGMSYVAMYAVDMGNPNAQWDYVAWPAPGAFPVEMMRAELAWSVSLNDALYDLSASRPEIYMEEKTTGTQFHFDVAGDSGDGYCALSTQLCGSGSCIIFRPEIEKAGIAEYVQNQIWSVEITGLRTAYGSDTQIAYSCEMASLYPQDVANVELSQLEARLVPSETLSLQASVIPAYADDLSIIWGSSDPTVASVNPDGMVNAISPGTCQITAMSANGRRDVCTITVE